MFSIHSYVFKENLKYLVKNMYTVDSRYLELAYLE